MRKMALSSIVLSACIMLYWPTPTQAAGSGLSSLNDIQSMFATDNFSFGNYGRLINMALNALGIAKGINEIFPLVSQQDTARTILKDIPERYKWSLTPTGDFGFTEKYSTRLAQRAGYGGGESAAASIFSTNALKDMQSDFVKSPATYNKKMYESMIRWHNTQQTTLDAIMAGQAKVIESMQKHQEFVAGVLNKSTEETSLMAVAQYQNMLLMTISAQLSDLATLQILNSKLGILNKQSELVQETTVMNDNIIRSSKFPAFENRPVNTNTTKTSEVRRP